MNTLQNEYNQILEGKGNKIQFLKQAKLLFPQHISSNNDYNTTISILKSKSILTENITNKVVEKNNWFKIFENNINEGLIDGMIDKILLNLTPEVKTLIVDTYRKECSKGINQAKLEEKDYYLDLLNGIKDCNSNAIQPIFNKFQNINEAKYPTELSKEVLDNQKNNFNTKDDKNIDNLYGQTFINAYYLEIQDPANAKKTVDEIKNIVAKNMAKDRNYYVKNGQFGIKGLGYKTSTETKAVKGAYKSSGNEVVKSDSDVVKNGLINAKATSRVAKLVAPTLKESTNLTKLARKILWDKDISPKEFATQVKSLPDSTLILWSKDNNGIPNSPLAFQQKLVKIEMAKRGLKENNQSIGKNYPGSLTGEYEGEPVEMGGSELYDYLKGILDISNNANDFVNKVIYGITNNTDTISDEDKEKLKTWYETNTEVKEAYLKEVVKGICENENIDWSDLDAVKKEAQQLSQDEGVTQHVNRGRNTEYTISDWYDEDKTVASYEGGMQLEESSELNLNESKKPKKDDVATRIKKIGKASESLALEAKIEGLTQEIQDRKDKITMAETMDELQEFVNPAKIKEIQKEIKVLEQYKTKCEKMYERMTGSKKKEIIDDNVTEEESTEENLNEMFKKENDEFIEEKALELIDLLGGDINDNGIGEKQYSDEFEKMQLSPEFWERVYYKAQELNSFN